ncbi:hypothetical protein [Bradyrhizobium genomosp. I (2014)]|uniref:hypothetical protein n=1 Tax=Bradyrhizobium genomosp. I (2014) TaxID=2683269 RepID=UPI0009D93182|nr:hypothetical protein [Bradyrhizobium sp. CCBAU 43298]
MSEAEKYIANAENCIELAEQAQNAPAKARYRRMAEAWLALAKEQEWLDGEITPLPGPDSKIRRR